jgi:DNA repair protein RadD
MSMGPICHKDHLLNEVCYEAHITDLINDGFLSKLRSKEGSFQPDTSGVKKRGGEYITSSLSGAVNQSDLISRTVGEVLTICHRERRRSIVFFCVDINHCNAVSKELSKRGVIAPTVTSKTPIKTRDRIAHDFKSGKLHCICNVNVYTEGFNATRVDCIVLLRPTMSPGLFSQMVGRGLRLHPGKHYCLVLDYANCIDEHGPIDLLGRELWTALATCPECRESFSRAIRNCPICGWEIPKLEIERLDEKEKTRRMHNDKASDRKILSSEPETLVVDSVNISKHCKVGSPDSLLVRYRCGMRTFREWICLNRDDFAGKKAREWWYTRFGDNMFNKKDGRPTVNYALENWLVLQDLRSYTKTITVCQQGKHWRVVEYNKKPTMESELLKLERKLNESV